MKDIFFESDYALKFDGLKLCHLSEIFLEVSQKLMFW